MTCTFKGHKTGFNRTGSNDCAPNEMGPPDTSFKGRGAVPDGQLKHYPGAAADISSSNRRFAKSKIGADGGSSTSYGGHPTGFSMRADTRMGKSKAYNTGGGKGSGTNRK